MTRRYLRRSNERECENSPHPEDLGIRVKLGRGEVCGYAHVDERCRSQMRLRFGQLSGETEAKFVFSISQNSRNDYAQTSRVLSGGEKLKCAPPCKSASSVLVVEHNGPNMFARIGVMWALNRHGERVFNPDRKDTHWGKSSWRAIDD